MGWYDSFKQMLQKIGLKDFIEKNTDLLQSGSNRGYKTSAITERFTTSIWCGANRFSHTKVTRHDRAWGKLFDWKNTPGQVLWTRYAAFVYTPERAVFTWLLVC